MSTNPLAAGAAAALGLGSMGMGIPSLTGGAGGAAGPATGTSNNGISMPNSLPVNIDGSGWVINFGNGNSSKAGGNTGANQTQQTATPNATSSGSGGNGTGGQPYIPAGMPGGGAVAGDTGYYDPLGGLLSGSSLPLVLGALGVFLLLTHK